MSLGLIRQTLDYIVIRRVSPTTCLMAKTATEMFRPRANKTLDHSLRTGLKYPIDPTITQQGGRMTLSNSLRSTLQIIGLILVLCAAVSAQKPADDVEPGLKFAEQPESPIRLEAAKTRSLGPEAESVSITVENVGQKSVWGFVLTGVAGSRSVSSILGAALMPGSKRTIVVHVGPRASAVSDQGVAADHVKFADGSSWGADSAGEAETLEGMYAGRKAVIADVRKLVEAGEDGKLIELLTAEPYLPEIAKIEKKTKWQRGFMGAYGSGLMTFRTDMRSRGDLTGIASRLAMMDREFDLAPAKKQ